MAREIGDEVLVGIGFFATNPVVEVHDAEYDAQIAPHFQQGTQEGYTVRTAGNGSAYAISWAEEGVGADVL